jgi:ATP-dependent Clp protease ATP-binding subunit ClpC
MLNAVAKRLQERGVELVMDETAVKLLAKSGFDQQYGARPLRRAIQRMVEDSLSEELLSGSIHMGERVQVTAEGDQLKFTPVSQEKEQDAEAQATSAPAV